jgi:hypothetical protein
LLLIVDVKLGFAVANCGHVIGQSKLFNAPKSDQKMRAYQDACLIVQSIWEESSYYISSNDRNILPAARPQCFVDLGRALEDCFCLVTSMTRPTLAGNLPAYWSNMPVWQFLTPQHPPSQGQFTETLAKNLPRHSQHDGYSIIILKELPQ